MILVPANGRQRTVIGRLGENEHRCIVFRESAQPLEMYPEASVTVLHQRPGDPAAYPVAPEYVQIIGGVVQWTVQSGDLAKEGKGQCEVVFEQDGVIAKSLIYETEILTALDGAGTPPEPWESWQETVANDAEDARKWANGTDRNGDPVEEGTAQFENNAKYHAQQAAQSATDANSAKDAVLGMSAQGNALSPGSTPTASYSNGVLTIGIPPGTTFTPSVSNAGLLSWTNDGGAHNPQSVDIAGLVRGVFDVSVSGTDPVITGADNCRYTCGEVYTISITPPASGHIIVIFESGTTAAVMTISNVVWPEWFDATSLETDTVYELSIANGRGAVMTWPTT